MTARPGRICHRSFFDDWWLTITFLGNLVDELSKPLLRHFKAESSWWLMIFDWLIGWQVLGDAALVWDQLFVAGILCFAAAHFFYIKALNLKGTILGRDKFRSIGLGVSLYGAAFLIWFLLIRAGLQDESILKFGVPLYIIWLTTTVWRAGCVGDDRIFWGAVLFMFSDCCIGINLFSFSIPFAQVWIMSTYQVGQYLIAMSTFLPQNQMMDSSSVSFKATKIQYSAKRTTEKRQIRKNI